MSFVINEENYVGNIYQRFPVNIEKGKGCFLWDIDGKRFHRLHGRLWCCIDWSL